MACRLHYGRVSAHGAATAMLRTALLAFCLSAGVLVEGAQAWPMSQKASPTPHIDAALQSYALVERVKPSRIGAEDFRKVIRTRVQCYEQVTTPLERKKPCNISYVESIIHAARKNIKSVPDIGLFIRDVQYCPIVYNMCIGDMNSREYCIDFERRCVDRTLDKFWRGTPENVSHD
ncbi:MAG TPA: hypothetical protein VN419_05515 [Humidesulfovibrio sp.]|uniref:hypothetical protein n=1 Tax=Humidesulfovibrio sp. TaxID=2910988 RepID=UPI002B5EBC9F|nr:hypothetical protein [Humidesulfovibrio sp.]HWR03458.1 hypothetical protein [Humidesulfovibrio sp.]